MYCFEVVARVDGLGEAVLGNQLSLLITLALDVAELVDEVPHNACTLHHRLGGLALCRSEGVGVDHVDVVCLPFPSPACK